MPPKPTDGGRSASLGQRAAENESDPQAAAKKHASGKPDRARTKPPTYGEPALRRADERTRAMPLAGDSRPELAAKSARMRTAVGRPATPTCSMGWGCPTAKAREQLLGADIAQGGAADIPASRASTSLSASASMLSTSSNARSIPCSGSTVSSMRSAPTWASHSLKGSAFGEGTDWMMRRTP